MTHIKLTELQSEALKYLQDGYKVTLLGVSVSLTKLGSPRLKIALKTVHELRDMKMIEITRQDFSGSQYSITDLGRQIEI